jgi:glycosyltransferase involved in cell wall biosynthesis
VRIGLAAPLTVERLLPWLDLDPAIELPIGMGGPTTTTLLRGLLDAGHDVVAVTFDARIEQPVVLRGERLTLHLGPYRGPRPRTLDYCRAERAYVRTTLAGERPSVIGAHWTYEFALGAFATKIPTVVSLHDWAPTILRYMGWRLAPYFGVRMVMHMQSVLTAGVVTVNSPPMAEHAERWVRGPVHLVPNSFEPGLFDFAERTLNADTPTILAANNGFNRWKNTSTLLEAFSLVRSESSGARLLLAGEGHADGGPAHQWALPRRLCAGVEFLGEIPRPQLIELMKTADLFIHASRDESFGDVLVEAMAQGTPVIGGNNSGAVPWVLDGGRAGVLTDIESPHALAATALRLLDDPQRWAQYSARGRSTSYERFNLAKGAALYASILEAALQRETR